MAESVSYHETSTISCSPLNPTGRGQLICSDNEPVTMTTVDFETKSNKNDDDDEGNENDENVDEEEEVEMMMEVQRKKPGTKCYLKCPRGYELHGEYELTCLADGTWDGPKHGECLREFVSFFFFELSRISYFIKEKFFHFV